MARLFLINLSQRGEGRSQSIHATSYLPPPPPTTQHSPPPTPNPYHSLHQSNHNLQPPPLTAQSRCSTNVGKRCSTHGRDAICSHFATKIGPMHTALDRFMKNKDKLLKSRGTASLWFQGNKPVRRNLQIKDISNILCKKKKKVIYYRS